MTVVQIGAVLAPFLLIRYFFNSFFPLSWAGISALVYWYAVGFGLARFTTDMNVSILFTIWNVIGLVLVVLALFLMRQSDANWKEIAFAFLLQSYTFICAYYYGGLEFTHKT